MVKKITQKRLENITLYYLQRYESSSGKLRDMLKRRVLRVKMQLGEVPNETNKWIEDIIKRMQELGYVDDKRYAQNTFRRLQNAGKSTRFIAGKLKQSGIGANIINQLIEEQENTTDEMDLNTARQLVKKKKLGYLRPPEKQQEMHQKDLAVLGRAGFSYEIACQALKGED
ncbi:MAG: regulatory protein RecX [Alphaproteobacteria bacterium]|nr:regulatory protein RecX [Alphaproteobacteria bacterium]